MKRHGIGAKIRPALEFPGAGDGFRQVFPFRRVWVAIIILAVFNAIFIIPAVMVYQQAASGWSEFEDLFDLVAAIFSSAWLLGWSIGPLIMTVVLLLMLFGREVVRIRDDALEIFIGLPLIGFSGRYNTASIRNLRIKVPEKKSKDSWRGPHLQFDYGANDIAFGSNVRDSDLSLIENKIRTISGRSIRTGDATPEELEGNWAPSTLESISASTPIEQTNLAPLTWSSPTALALIIANLVPVAGMVYLGWNLGDVMVLYWAESAVIGFFNVVKLAVIGRWMALFTGIFFIAHFGAFMAVHFMFIWGIFVKGLEDTSGGDLTEVAGHFIALWPALAALFVSHAISFFRNFIGRGEYRNRTVGDQMKEPYSRIVLMHIALILGGGLAMILGGPTLVLLLLIAGKIWLDVRAHVAQRSTSA